MMYNHLLRNIALSATLGLALSAQSQVIDRMGDLTAEQKAAATRIKVMGTPSVKGNSDFRQLRDLCYQLQSVDLGEANCVAIPNNAFHSRHHLREVVLSQNLQTIGSQAFYACTALQKVVIPQTVDTIGNAAFSSCTALGSITIEGRPYLAPFSFARLKGLHTVTLLSAVPPKASATAFYGIDRRRVRLNVPKGAEKAYRQAEGWRLFFEDAPLSPTVCNPSEVFTPIPAELTVNNDATPLAVRTKWNIVAPAELGNEANQARQIIAERIAVKAVKGQKPATLRLQIDPTLTDDEAYTLDVQPDGVSIKGRTSAGVFYGLMTFDQLLRADAVASSCEAIPQLHIADYPRTHIRELMVDPCRIFIPIDELKAFVPEMARYKLNALHLHLVDDQAWRIEIKRYPRLTEMSSSRVGMDDMMMPISGYYTQEEMRELVAYAAKYHVQVVPEIEMPGHEVAAIHAYPELTCHSKQVELRTTCGVSNELLCPGSEFTFEFLQNVFAELADVFPSPYIHLGGDEAGMPALDCWTSCPNCQALKRKLGIASDDRLENWRLQEYMFNSIIDILKSKHGKTPMFWYETDFKTIQPGCVTFAWRAGLTKVALDAAVKNNAKILLCPGEHCYFDYPMQRGDMPEVNWGMPSTSLKQTYSLDPSWGMGEEFEKNNLFGVAGTLWSECINTPERVYYQAYPRAIALAEVGWSTAKSHSWESFLLRLRPTLTDMQRRGLTFSMQF